MSINGFCPACRAVHAPRVGSIVPCNVLAEIRKEFVPFLYRRPGRGGIFGIAVTFIICNLRHIKVPEWFKSSRHNHRNSHSKIDNHSAGRGRELLNTGTIRAGGMQITVAHIDCGNCRMSILVSHHLIVETKQQIISFGCCKDLFNLRVDESFL